MVRKGRIKEEAEEIVREVILTKEGPHENS